MRPILAGIETEYGLAVEGRGAEQQVDDSKALVQSYPGECFVGWDYAFESPRDDLRGFKVEALKTDPVDAQFDEGRETKRDGDLRADRILANGARLYNDHGHPEFSTPECWGTGELALQDKAGETAVRQAAEALAAKTGQEIAVYKNNSDGHGASYGTHESYLVPRTLGFEALRAAVVPVLAARQVVCGSGKVGAEAGLSCDYQISQRADFFTEDSSVDTLYRRPVFNTRDEPHADRSQWIRLHVITGDANRILAATARKVAWVKLAIWLAEAGRTPSWALARPAQAMQSVSRDLTCRGRIELEGANWTEPRSVLESYCESAARFLDARDEHVCEALALAERSLELLDDWDKKGELMAREVDWAAKLRMLTEYQEAEGSDWSDPALRAYALEYHSLDPDLSLFEAMKETGLLDTDPSEAELQKLLSAPRERSRAWVRSIAVKRFSNELRSAGWQRLVFTFGTVELKPDVVYSEHLARVESAQGFVEELRKHS